MTMMTNLPDRTFPGLYEHLVRLFYGYWISPTTCLPKKIDASRWQSQKVQDPNMTPIELSFVNYEVYVPQTKDELVNAVRPNLPWAEDHFQERISGIPHNPPPSEKYWPFAQQGNSGHKEGEIFSHTYPERYWPKYAGNGELSFKNFGIRFEYGDLDDVITLLSKDPSTRQAYLPIWFPEDTGVVHGGRVPCSLGYHFLIRQDKLYCSYNMRSCDFLRHWPDDMYMTARLMQYVSAVIEVSVGPMICHISSLHVFLGDAFTMLNLMGEIDDDYQPTAF